MLDRDIRYDSLIQLFQLTFARKQPPHRARISDNCVGPAS